MNFSNIKTIHDTITKIGHEDADSDQDDALSDIVDQDMLDESIEVNNLDESDDEFDEDIIMDDEDQQPSELGNIEDYMAIDQEGTDITGISVETIVDHKNRVTSDRLSRYEMVELINIRSHQISKNPICFVDVSGLRDPTEMAIKELFENRCPLLVKREVAKNTVELWNPNEMIKNML